MKYQNVRKYSSGYPSKEQTLKDPMLLKNTPERWKGIAVCCSALSLVTFSACSQLEITSKNVLQGNVTNQQIMGMMIAPAYSLPEDEAVRIIADEYLLNGIEIERDIEVKALMPVNLTVNPDDYEYEFSELKTKFSADGKVKGKGIYFEYISSDDFTNFTTDSYFNEVYQRIEFMQRYIESKENGTIQSDKGDLVKIFYETVSYSRQEAEQILRQQVKEYIDQLKASGII